MNSLAKCEVMMNSDTTDTTYCVMSHIVFIN